MIDKFRGEQMENIKLQIKTTEIDANLQKEYTFVQISDMHLSYIDEESSDVDRNDHIRYHKQWDSLKREFASSFGEFCDDSYDVEPNIIFEKLCDYAEKANADALILSGDIIDRVTESSLRYLEMALSKISMPVITCLGNHAMINVNGEHFNQYDRIKRVVKNPEMDSYDFEEFEILTFDNGRPDITKEQIDFLKSKLSKDKRYILVVHKPLNLGEFGEKLSKEIDSYFFMGTERDMEPTKEFVSLVKNNSDRFIAVLCGHIHTAKDYKIAENLRQISTSSGLIGAGRKILIK